MSTEQRRQQLIDMLEDAHARGDADRIKELQADLAKEFPCSLEGEQDT
jgi:hypothetical protein